MEHDIFENGISGYAPQGGTGIKGVDGYNFYYSALSYDTMSDEIKNRIKGGKSLTNNENIISDVVYKTNDMILCSDGKMLIVTNNNDVEIIGSLIKQKTQQVDTRDSGLDSSVIFYVCTSTETNRYNYCNNSKSPLYHHRSAMNNTEYGVKIYTKNGYKKGSDAKICITFHNGMEFTSPCSEDGKIDSFFISNNYFVPYGKWEDTNYWGDYTAKVETEEYNTNLSNVCSSLLTDSSICITSGYIETSIKDKTDSSTQTMYRIPIIFKKQQS